MATNLSIALMIGASVGSAIAGLTRVRDSIATLRNQTLSTSQKLKSLSTTAAIGFTGVYTGIKATSGAVMGFAEPAIKFESAMADVKKVVDFKTPEGFKNLSDDLLSLTRTLPMTAEELAAITASGGQLGVAEADLKDFTTTIAKMSVAFDMSADASGDAMAKLANVYKIPISEIGNLGDAINELSNSSPAKASDIVSTLGRIGGVAKQFGLTENAAAALSNSFISLGKAPEVAGTAINGILAKLMTADKGGKKFQAALKTVGISAKDLKTAIAKDGQGALVDFLKRLEKLPKEAQMGTLVDLFGLEYADDVAVLAGNVEVLEKSLSTLQDTDANGKPKYLGSMQKEFESRAATTENSLKLLSNSFTEIGVTLGSAFLPIITSVVSSLSPLIHGIADFIKQNQWVGETLTYVVLGLGGAVTAFSALNAVVSVGSMALLPFMGVARKLFGIFSVGSRLISGLSFVISKLALGFGYMIGYVIKGAIMFGKAFAIMARALLTNPIGLIITGIAVAAYLIYDNWGKIAPWFANLWQTVSGYFSQFWGWVQEIWSNVSGRVASAWGGITGFFSELWTTIGNFFSSGIGNISDTILNWSPLGLFYQAFQSVMAWFGVDLPASFSEFGANIINGLVNGIKNAWEGAKKIVSDLGSGIKNWFAEKLGIHSPSRVFMGYGENTVQGLAIGIADTAALAANATKSLGDTVASEGKSAGEKAGAITSLALNSALKIADTVSAMKPQISPPAINAFAQSRANVTQASRTQTRKKTLQAGQNSLKIAKPAIAPVATPLPIVQPALAPVEPEEQGFFSQLWSGIKSHFSELTSGLKTGLGLAGVSLPRWADSLLSLDVGKLTQPAHRTPDFNPNAASSPFAQYQPLPRSSAQAAQAQPQPIVVHFNPTIHIGGEQTHSAESVKASVMQVLQDNLYEFEQLLKRVQDQQQRRAY